MKMASWFDPVVRSLYPRLDYDYDTDHSKMGTLLGLTQPIPLRTSLRDMGHSLIQKGLIKKKPGYIPPESA